MPPAFGPHAVMRPRTSVRASPPAVSAPDPLSVLGSLAWWVRADQGITIETGVSQWDDLSGNGVNFTQGTAASQPTFLASAINGRPAVRSDGVDDVLNATVAARAAPATQPFYVWMIVNQLAVHTSNVFAGDYGPPGSLYAYQTPPNLVMYNGVGSANTVGGTTTAQYYRLEAQYTGSTADYLKVGSTQTTGTSAGNNSGGTNVQLFNQGNSQAARYVNIEMAEAFFFFGVPDSDQRAALDAYCMSLYGAGVEI